MAVDPERASASDLDSMEDEDETTKPTKKYTQENLLAALQDRLNEFNIEHLPAPVKRRIKALKQLQLKTTHIEAKFYEEVHALECRYYQLCAPYYEQRSNVVSGIYEPKDEECLWESEDEEEISTDLKSKVKIIEVKDEAQIKKDNSADDENVKGIPDFWLTIFKNVGMLAEMLQEHDEPILKHLYDIKVLFLEKDPMGFVLEFHFSPNDYFSNSVLTKEYHMKCVPEKDDPFSFEGPEIYKCKGCIIDWKKGKNVTVKTIKKSQKHKSRGSKRTVTKTVQNDSFFNFFTPPIVPDDADAEVDDETQVLLTSDFEIGHYIRERIVPRAILYFTGEGLEDEDEDYEEDDGDDDDGDDDDDDDEDEEDGSHSDEN
ncbi:nucleosome assembly protein 1-like isoform X2 [Nasonia vitripennis]|uniref:Nucleosome assembly protein 1-like 4 n=1 Tax=Nasonia vitripennis TaxID=7425 RepID=A0A7M7R114_NASVI|nr:nucleosome assembly protein 1-like isoform X2 [Nasonia vitripennis]XP_032457582.1 nucleosome assembly protein 1-like isoform X2 [Nasonia vitripennis]XP_032457583.1 nucleosome assembly protein 1-like isoform X2 [Nasonia vitripennis]